MMEFPLLPPRQKDSHKGMFGRIGIIGGSSGMVVLKGAGSVLARPDGTISANTTGNSALSAPGMGDVLTGMLAAFLARLEAWEALHRVVWLHGQAADDAVIQLRRQECLTATELVEYTRIQLNRL